MDKKNFWIVISISILFLGCLPSGIKAVRDRLSIINNIPGQWKFEIGYYSGDTLKQSRNGIIYFDPEVDKHTTKTCEQLTENGTPKLTRGYYSVSGYSDLNFLYIKTFDSTLYYNGQLVSFEKTKDKKLRKDYKYSTLHCIDSNKIENTVIELTLTCLYNRTKIIGD